MWSWESEAQELGISLGPGSMLNIGYEVTDRMCEKGFANKTAIVWKSREGNEKKLTYEYLAGESSRFAAFLKVLGISAGDRVFTYSDRVPEHYIAILGILKAGAVVGPLFSSFGREAIRDRLHASGASALVVQSQLLGNVLEIRSMLPELKHIIVIPGIPQDLKARTSGAIHDFSWYKDFKPVLSCEKTSPEDPAVIHYTSGTTGKPKGAVHVHAALLGHYATAKHILGLSPDTVYWCTADIAWVTGMSYGVIGPLANASVQISPEGNLTSKSIFDIIQKYGISVLYTAPTLLRMLMREKDETIRQYDLSSLRHIASVGEALNPEVIKWSVEKTGLPVHDTWFQTETGCIMIANYMGNTIKNGSMGIPATPVTAAILDDNFNPRRSNEVGHLALRPPWPSMFRAYRNNPEVYGSKFKNGWYLTGDKARKDENGYYWFVSRDDDVINTAGHLISPFEVESALLTHPSVAEAAVVGLPDPLLAEKIKAYIILQDGIEHHGNLKIEFRSYIRKMLSPYAVPQEIEFVHMLPKTKTGKIMRRLLKARELGLPEGDLSTLEGLYENWTI